MDNTRLRSYDQQLNRFQLFVQNLENQSEIAPGDSTQLKLRIEAIKPTLKDYTDVVSSSDEPDYDALAKFETTYFATLATAQTLMNETAINTIPTSATIESIRLPPINIPNFNGDYGLWLNFKSLFVSLVHENKTIGNIQKFQFLKTSLTDAAAEVIQNIGLTAENYDVAWQILIERYDNQRALTHHLIKNICNLENLGRETPTKIRHLVDTLKKNLRSLDALASREEQRDLFIAYLITSKLEFPTLKELEFHAQDSPESRLDNILDFLEARANLLDAVDQHRPATTNKTSTPRAFATTSQSCPICSASHSLYYCEKFRRLSVQDRVQRIKQLKYCLNCLGKGHFSSNCTSKSVCRHCSGKHNSLIHTNSNNTDFNKNFYSNKSETNQFFKSSKPEVKTEQEAAEFVTANSTSLLSNSANVLGDSSSSISSVIMPTALIEVAGAPRYKRTVRALLDSGSTCNLISESLCNLLNLNKHLVNLPLSGVGSKLTSVKHSCSLYVKSRSSAFKRKISCLVLPEITTPLPAYDIETESFRIPQDLVLADPNYAVSSSIDLLLGTEVFWSLLLPGHRALGPGLPFLHNTRLGWVIAGKLAFSSAVASCNLSIVESKCSMDNVHAQLAKFWEVEETPESRASNEVASPAEVLFTETTVRNSDNRFVVTVPLRDPPGVLGDSFNIARSRFLALEKRLSGDQKLHKYYHEFMNDYIQQGHMTLVNARGNEISYYMPHHPVWKETSSTTKLRVVFNASQPTSSGRSFNSIQVVGPVLQPELLSILLRFRTHRYALCGDIKQMYRQVLLNPQQRSLHRILWRSDPSQPLETYELNTVTYGTAAASFLSTRCLVELANEHQSSFPTTSNIIRNDSYVDDIITGARTLIEAQQIRAQLTQILSEGCFELRKWASNDARVLEGVSTADLHPNMIDLGSKEQASTLGLRWGVKDDTFSYSVSSSTSNSAVTKRKILSEISQIFDPLGLVSPIIISAKILLQALWLERLNWDDQLPAVTIKKWLNVRSELNELSGISIPRLVIDCRSESLELHGFSDASVEAYSACIYVVSVDENNERQAYLWCSKTKVAPLKRLTVPRLELLGTLLLTRLMKYVLSVSQVKFSDCHCWTDSSVALAWIKTRPCELRQFVSNRVAEIQDLSKNIQWHYVPTKLNPADIATRGTSCAKLRSNGLWWNGPPFLKSPSENWPILVATQRNEAANCEFKQSTRNPNLMCALINDNMELRVVEDYMIDCSSFVRSRNVFAYILRFIYNCRHSNKRTGPLEVSELDSALKLMVRASQRFTYRQTIDALRNNKLSKTDNLIALAPFVDGEGILRVGGRLRNSDFSYDRRHPILLSNKHCLSKLLVLYEHQRLFHAGPQTLLASLRDKYWIVSARSLVKRIVHNCVMCFRAAPRLIAPSMGELPANRVSVNFPFSVVGVDYAGPVVIRDRISRSNKTIKVYVCLFICFATKAVHLELVTDLSTKYFIAALRRFVSRRGKPDTIYSDHGRNFVGAHSQLRELYKFLISNQNEIVQQMSQDGIAWKFIPPRSPHFGGLWESNIKSCKYYLKRLAVGTNFTYEQYSTLLCEIESILNSRPLSPLSSDPSDLSPLTPAHFLIGRTLIGVPLMEPSSDAGIVDHRDNLKRIERMRNQFWQRWRTEYISELQRRNKWTSAGTAASWINGDHQGRQLASASVVFGSCSANLSWKG